jgi:hypothetical protein
MDRADEKAVQLICKNLNLDYEYDALRALHVFRQKVNSNDISQSLERCFGEEPEYSVSIYALRHMDTIFLYQRLTEVFSHV